MDEPTDRSEGRALVPSGEYEGVAGFDTDNGENGCETANGFRIPKGIVHSKEFTWAYVWIMGQFLARYFGGSRKEAYWTRIFIMEVTDLGG